MKRILVTGCGGNATIGFIRCLKAAKEKFYIVGTDSNPANLFFNITDKTYLIPPATSQKYIEALNKIIKKEKIDLIWSQPQPEILTISENRENIKAKVFLPSKEAVVICDSKIKTAEALSDAHLPIPKFIMLNKKSDLNKAFKIFGKNVWLRAITGAGGKGAFLAKNIKEALFWIEFNNGWGTFSAQEYLPGKGYGCDMLFYNGELIFSQVKERITYFMAKANIVGVTGTTGVLKTIHNSVIDRLCLKAVLAVDPVPNGVFAVDMKCDVKGNPKVTEINAGRFLSSSVSLFYKSNFLAPYYAVKIALDGAISEKIKKNNPIPKDIIINRQLDIEPAIISLKTLSSLENKLKYNLLVEVKS